MKTQMQTSLLETSRILRQVLCSALDQDVFAVVDKMPTDTAFAQRCFIVDQTGEDTLPSTSRAFRMPSTKARVVAIVDRSADIAAAARSLVEARVARNGRSIYALT